VDAGDGPSGADHEKYIGNNVFNKISFKLKQRRVVNPREMWIRAEGA